MGIADDLNNFCYAYKDEVKKPFSSNSKSYQLLVKTLPMKIEEIIRIQKLTNLKVKGSIGQGNVTPYPWLGVFDRRVSTGASKGYYVVFLFSDDYKDVFLTLNQCSTVQTQDEIKNNEDLIYSRIPSISGFTRGKIYENGLVRTRQYGPNNNGAKYENTTMFFKKYAVGQINEDQLINDLLTLIQQYQFCISLGFTPTTQKSTNVPFDYNKFILDIYNSGLKFNKSTLINFQALLCTKSFVILTGLSGSGKTKLALAFAKWITKDSSQICLVPVGADWMNREPLLGYPNALEPGKYVKPQTGVIDLLVSSQSNPKKPHFLILDEMNLSHVERYFADFLSAMESKDIISLHPFDTNWKDEVPATVQISNNLFIIGTVNVDETTYMFSPKVLDRAGTLEFKVTEIEMNEFLENPDSPHLELLTSKGSNMAESFVQIADGKIGSYPQEKVLKTIMSEFFIELKKLGAEFGYRTASEIFRFGGIVHEFTKNEGEVKPEIIADAAIMQKLLPKVHGSRRKLEPVLKTLISLCLVNRADLAIEDYLKPGKNDLKIDKNVRFPGTLEKLLRMYNRVIQDGFTSFAEA